MMPSRQDQIDKHEWELQERGRRAVCGPPASGMDAAVSDYRRVAAALESLPQSDPPENFAHAVAVQVERAASHDKQPVSVSVLILLMLTWIVVIVAYAAEKYAALQQMLGADALAWTLLASACIVLSWLCSRLSEEGFFADKSQEIR
jgi:hypothetical protein